jgi:hypothetical protein
MKAWIAMSLRFRRPSPALVVAIVAVVLASAGSAVAARLITSRQIKNGTIQRADLSPSVRSSIARRGPRGSQGPVGPAGIGKGYFVARTSPVRPLPPDLTDVIGLSGVAAGSYIIEGRGVAANFTPERFVRCVLRAGNQDLGASVVHVANDTSEVESIISSAAFSSPAPFDVALRCKRDGGDDGPYMESIKLWAIRVDDLQARTQP